jgi:hypothetical protein
MEFSGGARINDVVSYIGRYVRKEAKYMLKRHIINVNLTSCLTKDDTDLRVTIRHIRCRIGLDRSSHFQRDCC